MISLFSSQNMNGVMGLHITFFMQLYDIIIKQFYHAVVLFEQSNCIVWNILCYILSLTDIYFLLLTGLCWTTVKKITVIEQTLQRTSFKMMSMVFVFAHFTLFDNCFGHFNIAR